MCDQSDLRGGWLSQLTVLEDTAHHVGEGRHPQVDGHRESAVRKHREMKASLIFSVWDSMGWQVFLSQLNFSGNTLAHEYAHGGVFPSSKSSQLVSECEPPSFACSHCPGHPVCT